MSLGIRCGTIARWFARRARFDSHRALHEPGSAAFRPFVIGSMAYTDA